MTVYVDSNAGGANDGTSWTDAYTSLASTVSVAAGTEIWVENSHDERTATASTSWNWSNGTNANPVKILCVDSADDSLSTGAKAGTAASSFYNLTLKGNIYCYGIHWYAGLTVILTDADTVEQEYESCNFINGTFNSGAVAAGLLFGNSDFVWRKLRLLNCTFDSSSNTTSHRYLDAREACVVEIVNMAFSLGVSPSSTQTLFKISGSAGRAPVSVSMSDSDISAYQNLVDVNFNAIQRFRFARCKIHASCTPAYSTKNAELDILVENSDDGTITVPSLGVFKSETYHGSVGSTLSVYRTGGADDGVNANAYSWEMVTNANALEIYGPIESPPMAVWVAPDASPTGATAQGLFQSTRMNPRSTPSALTTDSGSTWNGTGVGTKQKITATIGDYTLTVYVASGTTLNDDDFWIEVCAPDQVGGPVVVKAFLAKPSTTVYVDPRLEVA